MSTGTRADPCLNAVSNARDLVLGSQYFDFIVLGSQHFPPGLFPISREVFKKSPNHSVFWVLGFMQFLGFFSREQL